ncbi:thioesterase II family protein [Kitasatospora sp. NPDC057015]|uniref:thioesterase II family protein n=1 Tax=Kitasatospora sp. NPDC057015 TaxID=3346001 RepID=UPI0036272323
MSTFTNSGGEWVRRFHPSDASDVRVVCFPHAGGSASYYYPMSEALSPGIETLALQYPGRQDRRSETPMNNLAEIADAAFEALRAWNDRPLVLFGHSFGSILAFEVARRLQDEAGTPPAWVFASGYPAPSRLRGGTIHLRDDAGIIEELRVLGGTAPVWLEDEDFMASVLPALRGDYTAIETYPTAQAEGVRLDSPLTMLVGDVDPHASLDEAEAWSAHTTGEFDLRVFPGGHFYLDQHGPELTDLVSTTVKRILG